MHRLLTRARVRCSRASVHLGKQGLSTSAVTSRRLPRMTRSASTFQYVAYTALASVLGTAIAVAFNHQKSSASITHSTYYAVRRDPIAAQILGNNIRYRDFWPWISGEINQIKGNIDFSYAVQGDKAQGILHFHCIRQAKNSQEWTILDWSLRTQDGDVFELERNDLTA